MSTTKGHNNQYSLTFQNRQYMGQQTIFQDDFYDDSRESENEYNTEQLDQDAIDIQELNKEKYFSSIIKKIRKFKPTYKRRR